MSTLMRATLACHTLAAGAVAIAPHTWKWALGGLVFNHMVLTAAGLWPRSDWLGPNMTRLPRASAARSEVALTIDDGPDPEVTPRVLDILDRHQARCTFFCIAERISAHPDLAREIVSRGHSLQNHTYRHPHHFSLMGPARLRAEIIQAQEVIANITGVKPIFFRAPAGLRNPFLEPVLHRLGLTLVSWTRRGFDTREPRPERVLARLTHKLSAGDILLLHDGNAAHDEAGQPVVLNVLPALLDQIRQSDLRCVSLTEILSIQGDAS
jgi:peptidoglycan/xylan/chitin deacetylase (PgdA/CDA1 family)